MPTKRTRRTRQRRSESILTGALLCTLADPESLHISVGLEIAIGNPPFDQFEDTPEGIAQGVALLRKLWPQHREEAIAYCVRHYGLGHLPTLEKEKKQ